MNAGAGSRRPTQAGDPDLARFFFANGIDDWESIARLIIDSANVLNHAGASFAVLPDNVAHHALPRLHEHFVVERGKRAGLYLVRELVEGESLLDY